MVISKRRRKQGKEFFLGLSQETVLVSEESRSTKPEQKRPERIFSVAWPFDLLRGSTLPMQIVTFGDFGVIGHLA